MHMYETADLSEIMDSNGMINGQRRGVLKDMKFGRSTVGRSGCEAIAVFNVLRSFNVRIALEDIIVFSWIGQYMWLWGLWGIRTDRVKDLISAYGGICEELDPDAFTDNRISRRKRRNNMAESISGLMPGDRFVMSIWNDRRVIRGIFHGIHTFAAEYRPDIVPGRPWTVYNRVGDIPEAVRYEGPEDILVTYDRKKGRKITGKYISIYRVSVKDVNYGRAVE